MSPQAYWGGSDPIFPQGKWQREKNKNKIKQTHKKPEEEKGERIIKDLNQNESDVFPICSVIYDSKIHKHSEKKIWIFCLNTYNSII